jgi:hypothetical protein
MRINNVNVEAMGAFAEQVRADPNLGKKQKRVEGSWNFEQGRPQFFATMAHAKGEHTVEADFAPFMLGPTPNDSRMLGVAVS